MTSFKHLAVKFIVTGDGGVKTLIHRRGSTSAHHKISLMEYSINQQFPGGGLQLK